MKNKKIVFYLIGKKGFYCLTNFIKTFDPSFIEYVVTSEDKNIKKDYYKEITELCRKEKIKYFKKTDKIFKLNNYKFAIGWRWMIKDSTNLIVLHDSILPKYRGFAPLVNMLINGEKNIGVTALFATESYDKGEIIAQQKIKINYPIKIYEAINIISPLYFELIKSIFGKIYYNKKIISTIQKEKDVSYSLWRDDEDYFINWKSDSATIKRTVDALGYPYNGARSYLDERIVIIEEAVEVSDLKIENRDPGKIIFIEDNRPIIVCGKGLLQIKKANYINSESIFPLKKFRIRFK